MKYICRYMLLSCIAVSMGTGAEPDTAAPAAAQAGGSQIVNRIAATVNGRPITSNEVRARLMPYLRELLILYPKQGPRFTTELVKAKRAVIDELIERELVLSDFEERGLILPDTMIDEEINRRILYQFNGRRDLLLDTLRQSGMTYSDFRQSVQKELTVATMRNMRYDRGIPPTPDEINEEYQSTKSDYRDITQDRITYDKIFIPAISQQQMATMEDNWALATDVKRQIDEKKISFADAARRYSADARAKEGGAWPTIKRADLAVEFANIVFSLEPGKVVGPLLDPSGYTIVRVRRKQLAPAPPLSEVKDAVDDAVRRKQSEKRYREWVERLREKAVIRTYI